MKIHPDFITEGDEDELRCHIEIALERLPQRKREGRNRILRFGWDYLEPEKWLGHAPSWIPRAVEAKIYESVYMPGVVATDSWTLNEYLRDQSIAPHIDSKAFGDVAILSLLADCDMVFTPLGGGPVGAKLFRLPRRSLAVMSGELRHKWKHSTLPLEADLRYSVVYRRKIA